MRTIYKNCVNRLYVVLKNLMIVGAEVREALLFPFSQKANRIFNSFNEEVNEAFFDVLLLVCDDNFQSLQDLCVYGKGTDLFKLIAAEYQTNNKSPLPAVNAIKSLLSKKWDHNTQSFSIYLAIVF